MLKKLKYQLWLLTGALIIVLLASVWLITRGHWIAAVVFIALGCIIGILLNFWFRHHVLGPVKELSEFSTVVASGRYGVQLENSEGGEIGELTDRINDLSQKVAIGEKYRTEFVSQVSHELRTPLTAIMGWSETIAYDPAVQGDSLRGINIISKEAERLTGMVSELLEFTRIQDGRFNLRIELIDIAAELEDSLFTYGELMKQNGIELDYSEPEAEISLIPGDPERLKQVFLNLLDNAAKHGGDGKKIDVGLSAEGEDVHIFFRDYGKGFPEEELPHVKEKFYKGSSKNRGTGIGLSVCDEIITRHGGELTVSNAEGGGCRVEITLPAKSK